MVNCQYESTKTSARNTCSRFVTDIEIQVNFKIQSNDPDHELVTKGQDSQRKHDSDDFNLTYFMSCFAEKVGEMYQKSWCTCRAIVFANEPFVFERVLAA